VGHLIYPFIHQPSLRIPTVDRHFGFSAFKSAPCSSVVINSLSSDRNRDRMQFRNGRRDRILMLNFILTPLPRFSSSFPNGYEGDHSASACNRTVNSSASNRAGFFSTDCNATISASSAPTFRSRRDARSARSNA
jgi:hypothetical protein